ncbi:hypothetical protein MRX96_023633 [Rhipicephalus microplus]
MFQYDVVAAFKHGAIGHMITKRFIQRLSNTNKWPTECSQPAGSKATSVPENLLAYQCVADSFRSDLALNSSAETGLPYALAPHSVEAVVHHRLRSKGNSPGRCDVDILQDCRKRGLVVEGSCETAALLRLPIFANAFGCKLQEPACNFARSNG